MTLPAPGDVPKLVGIKESAELLGISRRHLLAFVDRGELPSVKIGRRRLIRVVDLHAFIDARLDVA